MRAHSAVRRPASRLGRALSLQVRILHALMIREAIARFGRQNISFAWFVAEPAFLTAGVVVTWAIIRPAEEHGVSIIAFVVSSYMPMALWRHIIFRSMQCVRANAQLLYHRAVTPMDILTSRLLLELAGGTLAFVATYGLLQAFGYLEPVADIGTVIGGWVLLFWYSAGQGMLAAAWTETSESADKLIPPLTYLILPFSGMFFMADWLPSAERELVLLVPNVHCFEMIRSGVFGPSVQTYWDAGYVAAWSLGLSAAGLLAMRKVRKHVRFE